jgi:2-(1,2-epoxy-1,2-dihydrophenyl)acetyl-CoA isomerase
VSGTATLQEVDGIAWQVGSGIARIVLRRPAQQNTLTPASSRALARAIDEVLAGGPRVILMTAEGRTFCAGGDIGTFVGAGARLDALIDEILNTLHPALYRLATAPVPLIAAVQGAVAGAGIGLALCADFVLGGASMKLRTGYAALGLSPDAGASCFLARRAGAMRAQRWLMLSEAIDADECLRCGVIDALHPDAQLADAAEALAARLAGAATGSLAAIKTLCGGLPGHDLHAHLALEQRLLVARAGSADGKEGPRAFAERRAPRFDGL